MTAEVVARLRAAGCVFAEREAALVEATFADPLEREHAVERRERGEPLEYVLGFAQFCGVKVAIGPPAFIPRVRAEAIVHAVQSHATAGRLVVVDLGCGVGAIAAALCARYPDWDVHACDLDAEALIWARSNARRFGFRVHQGSWFAALPATLRGRIDVVVAHLPYVPTAQIDLLPRDFRDHEARRALDGGIDGLDPLRAVAATCADWLDPAGVLVTQVSREQRGLATRIVTSAELVTNVVTPDGDDDTAVLVLRRPDLSADA